MAFPNTMLIFISALVILLIVLYFTNRYIRKTKLKEYQEGLDALVNTNQLTKESADLLMNIFKEYF